MAKLTTTQRNKMSSSQFGMPGKGAGPKGKGSGSYPMPDKSHAANAKARATQQVKAGNLTPAQKAKIDAKANKVLGNTKKK